MKYAINTPCETGHLMFSDGLLITMVDDKTVSVYDHTLTRLWLHSDFTYSDLHAGLAPRWLSGRGVVVSTR